MSVDPMALVQEARPKPSPDATPFQPVAGAMRKLRDTWTEDSEGNRRSVSELATIPGSPSYAEKIPNPPCGECGQDHNPIATAKGLYSHAYVHPDHMQAPSVQVIPMGQPPAAALPPGAAGGASPLTKRLSIFPGRGEEDYVLVVEQREGDDWEDFYKGKLTGAVLASMLPFLDALDVKIKDRTGGDLVGLRER